MAGVYMPNGDLNRMKTAKQVVADYLNDGYLVSDHPVSGVTVEDIYIVWFCKTLQNWKALLSTDVLDSGIYFEVTFNGDKGELYFDHYAKVHNRAISIPPRSANMG
jgi:hypothetical protein